MLHAVAAVFTVFVAVAAAAADSVAAAPCAGLVWCMSLPMSEWGCDVVFDV